MCGYEIVSSSTVSLVGYTQRCYKTILKIVNLICCDEVHAVFLGGTVQVNTMIKSG